MTPAPPPLAGPVGLLAPLGVLNLRVCRITDFQVACDDIINNENYTPTGINSFYKMVCGKYIAIPKLFVANYIK